MSMQFDYWCKPSTPEDLKNALVGGDQDRLRHWCKDNPDRLELALECIHPQHSVHRDIVRSILLSCEKKNAEEAEERRHRHNLLIGIVVGVLTLIGTIAGVIQCQRSNNFTAQEEAPTLNSSPQVNPAPPPNIQATPTISSSISPAKPSVSATIATTATPSVEPNVTASLNRPSPGDHIRLDQIAAQLARANAIGGSVEEISAALHGISVDWTLQFQRAERLSTDPNIMLVFLSEGEPQLGSYLIQSVYFWVPVRGNEHLPLLDPNKRFRVRGIIRSVNSSAGVRLENNPQLDLADE